MPSTATFLYDRTFDGLLTAVFDAFVRKQLPSAIKGEDEPLPLFHDEVFTVVSDEEKAGRVWRALEKKLSKQALTMLTVSYLAEEEKLDMHLFNYICKAVKAEKSIETFFTDEDVRYVTDAFRRVRYERLRMMQFVRFQKAKDGTYFAIIRPDYNVVPLIIPHFEDRFANQPWIIYDVRRNYGCHYNGSEVKQISFADDGRMFDPHSGKLKADLLDENETLFQELWRTYFKAVCIKERLNPRKHRKDMPVRYWAYMTEKQ